MDEQRKRNNGRGTKEEGVVGQEGGIVFRTKGLMSNSG